MLGTSSRFAALTLVLLPAHASAQGIRASQPASVTQWIASTEVRIDYSRPVARGRTIFGELVKWGEVWTPGADTATAITFSTDVTVEGHELQAGSYSVWAIPRPDTWTIIFSRATPVYHTPYPEGREALRFDVQPVAGSHMETLAFYLPVVDLCRAVLHLHWAETIVPIEIRAP